VRQTALRFAVLGRLRAWHGDIELPLGPQRQRAMLAALLLSAGRPVTVDRLIDFIWPDNAPDGAAEAVHTYAERLRTALDPGLRGGPGRTGGGPGGRGRRLRRTRRPGPLRRSVLPRRDARQGGAGESVLRTVSRGGYLLDAGPDQVDLLRVRALAAAAGRDGADAGGTPSGGRGTAAHDLLAEAMTHVAGPPADDLDPAIRSHAWVAAAEREVLATAVAYARAAATTGRVADAAGRLAKVARWAPRHEPLHAGLIRVLRMAGRRDDAVAVYERLRARLAAEAGREPGPEVEREYRTALSGAVPWTGRRPEPDPLIGRDGDLEALAGLITTRRCVTLTGPGGVGKTALALALARRAAPAFDQVAVVELGLLPPERPSQFPNPVTLGEVPAATLTRRATGGATGDRTGRLAEDKTGRRAEDKTARTAGDKTGPPAGETTREESGGAIGDDQADAGDGSEPPSARSEAAATDNDAHEAAAGRTGDALAGHTRAADSRSADPRTGASRDFVAPGSTPGGSVPHGSASPGPVPPNPDSWGAAAPDGDAPLTPLFGLLARTLGADAAEAARVLRGRRVLLVLDNADHVVRACAWLAGRLLGEHPALTVLTTAHGPLDLADETVWEVSPLCAASDPRPVSLDLHPAVRLFSARARHSAPEIELSRQLPLVWELCRRLGGLPLAIEVAAARLRSMSPLAVREQITAVAAGDRRSRDRDRSDRQMEGPAAGTADAASDRGAAGAGAADDLAHAFAERVADVGAGRTAGGAAGRADRGPGLGAAVQWSYDLLPETERRLLCRLAVFAGPFPLDAAEEVAGWGAIQSVEPVLDNLVACAFLRAEGEQHYRLLPPIREFALARAGARELMAARRRHQDRYIRLAEQTVGGPRQAVDDHERTVDAPEGPDGPDRQEGPSEQPEGGRRQGERQEDRTDKPAGASERGDAAGRRAGGSEPSTAEPGDTRRRGESPAPGAEVPEILLAVERAAEQDDTAVARTFDVITAARLLLDHLDHGTGDLHGSLRRAGAALSATRGTSSRLTVLIGLVRQHELLPDSDGEAAVQRDRLRRAVRRRHACAALIDGQGAIAGSRLERARTAMERAVPLLDAADLRERRHLAGALLDLAGLTADPSGLAQVHRAVGLARSLDDPVATSAVLARAAEQLAWRGRCAEADMLLGEAPLLDRHRHRLAMVDLLAGRLGIAGAHARAVSAAAGRPAPKRARVMARLCHCWAELLAGDPGAALRLLEDLVPAVQRSRWGAVRPELQRLLAHAHWRAGNEAEAMASLRAGVEAALGLPEPQAAVRLLHTAAALTHDAGSPAAAEIAALARECRARSGLPPWPFGDDDYGRWESALGVAADPVRTVGSVDPIVATATDRVRELLAAG
jgi:predicted ATPase/DNA-binding SARP family transcriptional activator